MIEAVTQLHLESFITSINSIAAPLFSEVHEASHRPHSMRLSSSHWACMRTAPCVLFSVLRYVPDIDPSDFRLKFDAQCLFKAKKSLLIIMSATQTCMVLL